MARVGQLAVVERLIAAAETTVCVLNHAGKPPISDGWGQSADAGLAGRADLNRPAAERPDQAVRVDHVGRAHLAAGGT